MPLALDVLKRQYDALFSEHSFETMSEYFDIAATVGIEFFGTTGFLTTDPENIETILSTRFEDYCLGSRRLATLPVLGEGIFGQDGSAWKHSRELIRRQFSRVQKQDLRVFVPHVEELIQTLGEAAAATTKIVDMEPFFFEYTLSTTTELLFGEPHNSLPEEQRNAVRDNFDYAALGMLLWVSASELDSLTWRGCIIRRNSGKHARVSVTGRLFLPTRP